MITIRTKERDRLTTMRVPVQRFIDAMKFRKKYLTPEMTEEEVRAEFRKHKLNEPK